MAAARTSPAKQDGQQPHQPNQYCPVGPGDPRAGHLAVQLRDLVAQGSCADHRGQVTRTANSQLKTYV